MITVSGDTLAIEKPDFRAERSGDNLGVTGLVKAISQNLPAVLQNMQRARGKLRSEYKIAVKVIDQDIPTDARQPLADDLIREAWQEVDRLNSLDRVGLKDEVGSKQKASAASDVPFEMVKHEFGSNLVACKWSEDGKWIMVESVEPAAMLAKLREEFRKLDEAHPFFQDARAITVDLFLSDGSDKPGSVKPWRGVGRPELIVERARGQVIAEIRDRAERIASASPTTTHGTTATETTPEPRYLRVFIDGDTAAGLTILGDMHTIQAEIYGVMLHANVKRVVVDDRNPRTLYLMDENEDGVGTVFEWAKEGVEGNSGDHCLPPAVFAAMAGKSDRSRLRFDSYGEAEAAFTQAVKVAAREVRLNYARQKEKPKNTGVPFNRENPQWCAACGVHHPEFDAGSGGMEILNWLCYPCNHGEQAKRRGGCYFVYRMGKNGNPSQCLDLMQYCFLTAKNRWGWIALGHSYEECFLTEAEIASVEEFVELSAEKKAKGHH